MAIDQLEAFLKKMQDEPALKNEVLATSTADDVARIALKLGFEFSGDELLRISGKKVGKVTVIKNDLARYIFLPKLCQCFYTINFNDIGLNTIYWCSN